MRRLTVELNLEELSKMDNNPMIKKIKSLEILQFLKDGPEEFTVICRVEFEDAASRVEDFVDDDIIELQMLDQEKDGAYTYLIRSKRATHPEAHFDPFASGGYLSVPFEIRDGRARITYLGNAKQIRSFLDGIEKLGTKYRIASITDAKFAQNSPLSRLTEKQRRVLVTAYRLGYYDEPRRISSLELARKMKVGSSTLINHRRRAERRLLAELVGQ
ncbi:MAG: helix-turn-helix domain-containing protein [Thaumarchaeota archaeon]|nr:helix-turn-helix domain-containing protein [Nitrososphaerota archaeon]